MFDFALQ